MAEFDPIPSKDATEAAYAQALLGDDVGREQRRARLMAALPRPEVVAAAPVARRELAWRWQPYALGVLATGLLVAAVLVLKGRSADPGPTLEPRVAAAPAASEPVVVAKAEPPAGSTADARVAAAPPIAAKIVPAPPPAFVPPPAVVVATASPAQRRAEVAAAVTTATEAAREAVEPPPMAAAPVTSQAPAIVAAAPVMPPAAPAPAPFAPPAAPKPVPPQAETLARAEAAGGLVADRSRMSLAASDAAPAKLMGPPEAILLAAVEHADLATARSALQAGAPVHSRDSRGRTALMLAARSGSREMVDLLLAAGARKADRDPQGWSAADHARDQGHEELVDRLR